VAAHQAAGIHSIPVAIIRSGDYNATVQGSVNKTKQNKKQNNSISILVPINHNLFIHNGSSKLMYIMVICCDADGCYATWGGAGIAARVLEGLQGD
jgi:hypothetical protein